MNVSKQDLIEQQQLLAALGFYKGEIDGIWSTETIKAKIAYERTREFAPAIPNYGMPFEADRKLPRGVMRRNGVLWSPELEQYQQSQVTKKEHHRAEPEPKSKAVTNPQKDAAGAASQHEQPAGE